MRRHENPPLSLMSPALSADEAIFAMARRPLWVKSAILTTGRPPSVFPDDRALSDFGGMS
jgi:hypothetical protein